MCSTSTRALTSLGILAVTTPIVLGVGVGVAGAATVLCDSALLAAQSRVTSPRESSDPYEEPRRAWP
jgi:hypothetical protein